MVKSISPLIIGIAVNPVDRLGPEAWLNHYTIICEKNYSWIPTLTRDRLTVISLKANNPAFAVRHHNTASIFLSETFQEILKQFQAPHALIHRSSRRIAYLAQILNLKVLANPYQLADELENKFLFRQRFQNVASFPPFRILTPNKLQNSASLFRTLQNQYGTWVLQHPISGGGKKTFLVHSHDDFQKALQYLNAPSHPSILIASKFISGTVASLQLCVTRHGIFSSDIQQQITAFVKSASSGSILRGKFLGNQWGFLPYSEKTLRETHQLTQNIGRTLQVLGYRGIIGIDIIIDENGHVFVLEANPRLTAATTPLTMLQVANEQTSLLQLHTEEFTRPNSDNLSESSPRRYWQPLPQASHFFLFNRRSRGLTLTRSLLPGVYNFASQKVTRIRSGYAYKNLKSQNEILLLDTPEMGQKVPTGEKILRIFTKKEFATSDGALSPFANDLIARIEKEYFV